MPRTIDKSGMLAVIVSIALGGCLIEPLDGQWYVEGKSVQAPVRAYLPWKATEINGEAFNFQTNRWVRLNDPYFSHEGDGFIPDDGTGMAWFPLTMPSIDPAGDGMAQVLTDAYWEEPPPNQIPEFARNYAHGFRRARVRFFTGEPGVVGDLRLVAAMTSFANDAETESCVISTLAANLGIGQVMRSCGTGTNEVHLWTCGKSSCPKPDGWH